ncbi:hypothetical protein KAK06_02190 [Ideonella sp. 4Y11]|uniref:Uncharacterized protein n=1 Tax=Ideonella aquatica TaxID=2824119 RepID=A0A940YGI3_9BURK|nr:hypothetical protein [Ideonella aquatica]MBQ0957756.1 hypothetical protein [Ideonella aquatica]
MAMVITVKTPATKCSRVGLSPWSVLNRHYAALLVSFRSAATLPIASLDKMAIQREIKDIGTQ